MNLFITSTISDLRQCFSDLGHLKTLPNVSLPCFQHTFMEQNETINNDQCWIYIIEQREQSLLIGIAGNLRQKLGECTLEDSKKLIFYRCFSDTLSALGFKLLLQNLSHNTIGQLIQRANPSRKDLSSEVLGL